MKEMAEVGNMPSWYPHQDYPRHGYLWYPRQEFLLLFAEAEDKICEKKSSAKPRRRSSSCSTKDDSDHSGK